MSRTAQDVFAHHAQVLSAGDLDGVMSDYAADAVLLTSEGPLAGHDEVRRFFAGALDALPEPELTARAAVWGPDALLLRWTAVSAAAVVPDGVDTFVFADGKIRLQTTVFTVRPRD